MGAQGAGIPLVDLSEPLSHGIGGGPRLIGATAGENGPGDAGELVGECDRQHVAVEPLRCLLDREERLHVLRRDQTHIVTSSLQLPADVMGTRTGFHADQAARNIGQTAFELTTGYLLLQDDCTPLVEADEVERVLAEVEPDRGDDPSCLLRCAHRMLLEPCFTPPTSVQQIRPLSAAEPSHDVWPGRALQDGVPRPTNVRAATMY